MTFCYSTKELMFCTITIEKMLVCILSEPLLCRSLGRVGITKIGTDQMFEKIWNYAETLKASARIRGKIFGDDL